MPHRIIDTRTLLLGALLSATTLTPLASARAAGWSATSTIGIPVAALANATDVGALPATQPLTVRVGMRMRNQASLLGWLKLFTTQGNVYYGRYFTPAEFARSYGASAEDIAAVTAYLQAAGFTNIVAEPNGLLISADGTAAMAEAAFNTKLEQISVGGTPGFMNITAAQVPAKFGNVVAGVLGLNTVGRWASTMALPLPQYLVSYTPPQFQKIYSAKVGQPSPNATIAIMAEGDLTGVLSDLRIAETAFGLPRVPVTVVPVGVASSDTSGADEWDLDTQFSTGMAQWVHRLYIYDTTSLSDSDLALEISRWATDDLARAASASLGECEAFPYIDGSMTIDDEIFLEAAVQGQTFFASAGDTGSFCPLGPAGVNGVPAGAPLVNYPAASPYVVGVGGTTLLTNTDGSYNSEVAWNTGGGGISQFEGSPQWQASDVPLLSTADSRGVPDVAMDADPNSGATVYVNGQPEAVGGTSLSSPLALGVWARAISANPKLGFASPKLYSLYDGTGGAGGLTGTYPKGGYHDITIGNNGLYEATIGYDLITGLGTFTINELLQDFRK
jgi:subtilase family serine protease